MTVFFDTETFCFAPGNMAPKVVCLQWCEDGHEAAIRSSSSDAIVRASGENSRITGNIGDQVALWLEHGKTLVGHNVAYDLAALCATFPALTPLVWKAYRECRIKDTMWRQKLADIGRGRYRTRQYDLGSVSRIHGGPVLNKDDPWRTRYGELDGVPLFEWPEEAIRYALLDAEATRAAYLGQETRYDPALLVDEDAQCRRFWALQLMSVWGLRTSVRGVESLRQGVEERLALLSEILVKAGLRRPDGSRDTKAAKAHMERVCVELGIDVKKTKGGDISMSSDACEATGDPLLEAYCEAASMAKVLSNDVKMLEKGIVLPIHTHFDLADTGRTTSAKPNTQNPRRLAIATPRGKQGVRECFVPRGYVEPLTDDTGAS